MPRIFLCAGAATAVPATPASVTALAPARKVRRLVSVMFSMALPLVLNCLERRGQTDLDNTAKRACDPVVVTGGAQIEGRIFIGDIDDRDVEMVIAKQAVLEIIAQMQVEGQIAPHRVAATTGIALCIGNQG